MGVQGRPRVIVSMFMATLAVIALTLSPATARPSRTLLANVTNTPPGPVQACNTSFRHTGDSTARMECLRCVKNNPGMWPPSRFSSACVLCSSKKNKTASLKCFACLNLGLRDPRSCALYPNTSFVPVTLKVEISVAAMLDVSRLEPALLSVIRESTPISARAVGSYIRTTDTTSTMYSSFKFRSHKEADLAMRALQSAPRIAQLVTQPGALPCGSSIRVHGSSSHGKAGTLFSCVPPQGDNAWSHVALKEACCAAAPAPPAENTTSTAAHRMLLDVPTTGANSLSSSGGYLASPRALLSSNGLYTLVMQDDGNLVIYAVSSGASIWASNTFSSSSCQLSVQGDGSLVIDQVLQLSGHPLWTSGTLTYSTAPTGPFNMIMQDDGNLVSYGTHNVVAWASNTLQPSQGPSPSPPPFAPSNPGACEGQAGWPVGGTCQMTTGTVVLCSGNSQTYLVVNALAMRFTPKAWVMAGSPAPVYTSYECCDQVVSGCTVSTEVIQGSQGALSVIGLAELYMGGSLPSPNTVEQGGVLLSQQGFFMLQVQPHLLQLLDQKGHLLWSTYVTQTSVPSGASDISYFMAMKSDGDLTLTASYLCTDNNHGCVNGVTQTADSWVSGTAGMGTPPYKFSVQRAFGSFNNKGAYVVETSPYEPFGVAEDWILSITDAYNSTLFSMTCYQYATHESNFFYTGNNGATEFESSCAYYTQPTNNPLVTASGCDLIPTGSIIQCSNVNYLKLGSYVRPYATNGYMAAGHPSVSCVLPVYYINTNGQTATWACNATHVLGCPIYTGGAIPGPLPGQYLSSFAMNSTTDNCIEFSDAFNRLALTWSPNVNGQGSCPLLDVPNMFTPYVVDDSTSTLFFALTTGPVGTQQGCLSSTGSTASLVTCQTSASNQQFYFEASESFVGRFSLRPRAPSTQPAFCMDGSFSFVPCASDAAQTFGFLPRSYWTVQLSSGNPLLAFDDPSFISKAMTTFNAECPSFSCVGSGQSFLSTNSAGQSVTVTVGISLENTFRNANNMNGYPKEVFFAAYQNVIASQYQGNGQQLPDEMVFTVNDASTGISQQMTVVICYQVNPPPGRGCSAGASDALAIGGAVAGAVGTVLAPAAFIGSLFGIGSAVCDAIPPAQTPAAASALCPSVL